ncbi:hypothetical protein [Micromonospora eburnea]|uniref:Uncharacterized protein n=1 Tax=Micromonospora eburnea TaxID=227316 RepID=A0A1C6TV14_9ACTN|nr:hypothetical protein [Micromonospora eburnea]SCL45650.1 hypothetical protein GA0070604_1054 [Micromonospora eburnea]
MFNVITVRQGTRSTLTGSHNLAYRALHQHDDSVLARREHPLSGPFQRRFRAGAGTRTGVTATADEADEEVTD